MIGHLVKRRTVWFPTLAGWLFIVAFVCGPLVAWWFWGEPFLAVTYRQPAEVLVVEGWIGAEGIQAAHAEFLFGGYQAVVITGGLTGERWSQRRWNHAVEGEEQMLRLGVPRDRLILAASRDVESQRTFEMATSAWRALQASALRPKAINVFTRGSHARRSRLIFSKVFEPTTAVGVISWKPPAFESEPWWQTSDRAEDMLKETVGYVFELLLSSGRRSNVPERLSRSAGAWLLPGRIVLTPGDPVLAPAGRGDSRS